MSGTKIWQEWHNPLPRWWMWLFYITIVFALAYLAVYPGLGTFQGTFKWSSTGAYDAEVKQAEAEYGPLFDKYMKVDIPTLAKDAQANAMGQRLFLNYCAQCHGSDAGGAKGYPNLRDKRLAVWRRAGDDQDHPPQWPQRRDAADGCRCWRRSRCARC